MGWEFFENLKYFSFHGKKMSVKMCI